MWLRRYSSSQQRKFRTTRDDDRKQQTRTKMARGKRLYESTEKITVEQSEMRRWVLADRTNEELCIVYILNVHIALPLNIECSRKNFKPLFSAGIVLPLEFWNYTFHPMRTTHAILPGHTSPGTKPCALSLSFLFFIPLGWQLGKTTDTRDNISLSLTRDESNSRQGLSISRNNCFSAYLRRPFPAQIFPLPKPNGVDASG